jgi:hypothetical protein
MATSTEKQPATYSESWSRGQQWPWGYITASNSSFQLKEIATLESFNRKLQQWNALPTFVLNLSKCTIYITDKTDPALKINI